MDRATLKQTAKKQMRAQQGTAILIGLVLLLFTAMPALPFAGIIISIFVLYNLSLGASNAYLKIWRGEEAGVGDMFNIGFEQYGRYLGGMLLVQVYTFLWSLLLVIPGIIKAYSYALTPYILREMPDLSVNEAIKLSTRMMNGHKLELFVIGLSFIGWNLLGGLTLGILNIVYITPYMNTTIAGFYDEVKKDAITKGIISPIEG